MSDLETKRKRIQKRVKMSQDPSDLSYRLINEVLQMLQLASGSTDKLFSPENLMKIDEMIESDKPWKLSTWSKRWWDHLDMDLPAVYINSVKALDDEQLLEEVKRRGLD